MLIVAFDTATVSVSVALADESGLVARFDAPRQRRHAETLLPALDSLLSLADLSRRDITHVCVDVGPGMFTGLRVGVTTAITIAYALDTPVVPLGSLEILAWRLSLDGAFVGNVGAVIDARRKECFAQPFSVTPGETPIPLAPAITAPPSDAAAMITSFGCVAAVGDGPLAYVDAFVDLRRLAPTVPDAASAALAAARLLDRSVGPEEVALQYLREPDAEIPKDLRS
jgi:tRNA threonylcarbamoyladenosine biosynthesis protein TsaB